MRFTLDSSLLGAELEKLGVRFHARGHVTCSGPSLALAQRLDALFVSWSKSCGAVEYRFPPFLAAADLAKTDYFGSFQHLATFPITLQADEAALSEFGARNRCCEGTLTLGPTAAVEEVLTPAACYHVYAHLSGSALAAPLYITTKAQCFRREVAYQMLQRQWSFHMREIVCVGDADSAASFLASQQAQLAHFFAELGMPMTFEPATDPFFRGRKHPKHFAQQLDPVKHELVLDGTLALGSLNYHRNYFGEAFAIRHRGELAVTACVAFGIERWLAAVVACFGSEPEKWPQPFRTEGAT
jgi:seryl-tRNA synthetase